MHQGHERDAWKGHACKRIMTSTYATRVPERQRACTHLYMCECCVFPCTRVPSKPRRQLWQHSSFHFTFLARELYIHLQKLSLHGSRVHIATTLIADRGVSSSSVIFKKKMLQNYLKNSSLSSAIKVENIWLGTNIGRRSSRIIKIVLGLSFLMGNRINPYARTIHSIRRSVSQFLREQYKYHSVGIHKCAKEKREFGENNAGKGIQHLDADAQIFRGGAN